MMLPEFKRLFKPYAKDGYSPETCINYLQQIAAKLKIDPAFVDQAFTEIVLEMAGGRKFPTDKCPCGCGIDKSGTAVTHAMRDRMVAIHKMTLKKQSEVLESRINAAILGHIHLENEKTLAAYAPSQKKTLRERLRGLLGRS